MNRSFTTALLLPALCAGWFALHAESLPPAGFDQPQNWLFRPGAEYPGATGSAAVENGKPVLHYDFSKGGRYVGMQLRTPLFDDAAEVAVTLVSPAPAKVTMRLTDANGRVFQSAPLKLEAAKPRRTVLSAASRWATSWGGDAKNKKFTPPMRSLTVQAHADDKMPAAGTVTVESLLCEVPQFDPSTLGAGKPFSFSAAGWNFSGDFRPDRLGQHLTVTAAPGREAQAGEYTVTLPQLNRDWSRHFQLDPAKGEQKLQILIPRRLISNPYNRYQLSQMFRSEQPGSSASVITPLAGRNSAGMEFDKTLHAREIPFSRIGTQVHFAYRTGGGFAAYAPYRMLTDEIAAAGFKWIRDTALVEQDEQGNYRVRPSDLEWIRYAHEQGLNVIVIFRLYANDTVDNYLKKVDAMVRDTREYVKVYELGNEPFGQGRWRETYGGPWNGKEKDNSTSPWVKEHLKYTNAIADRFKQVYPGCTVIGLGANTPTNYRYLDIGVTASLDGVTDHPYSYCLPPEKVPYGHRFAKRDGVRVGDERDSFRGLIEDYHRKFKETGKARSLWLTEFGYTTYWTSGSNEKNRYGTYTEEAQAVYIVRRLLETLSLPVEQVSQYCFVDKLNSRSDAAEGNFGLLRTDYSKKPAFYAMRRLNTRLSGFEFDADFRPEITAAPRQKGNQRGVLIGNWDEVSISADNDCMVVPFRNKAGERRVAVWSMQPYSREFNNRVISLRLPGMGGAAGAVAQDLITGVTYDLDLEARGGDLFINHLSLRENPLLIQFVK